MHKNIKSTIPTGKNVKPNLKRVRVVKFQKPLSAFNIVNNNLTILRDVSSNLNQNMAECNATKKRLRKVVHKIKLVESSKQQNQSLDLKSYQDQHALSSKTAPTAHDIFQTNKDGINLEEIVKQDHQATSVFKNTMQTVINKVNRGYYKNQYSEIKPMREMLNVSQALGNFGQGLSNDTRNSSINESENSTDAYSKTHPRAFIRRKLVAKRPFNLLPTTIPAKPTFSLGNVRPTKTVIRSKKKPSNPFNTNTQNKDESFLRKESIKSPLQNTVRLTQQNKYIDYEDQKDLPYTPLNSHPSGVNVFNRRPKSRQPQRDEGSEKKKGEDVDNEGKKHNRTKELFMEDTHKKVLIKANTSLANLLSDYSSWENGLLPASNTSRINVPYNPHIRQPNNSYPSAPDKQILSIYIPHLVKRPPVATISNLKSNLTQRPVAKNYEHTTPLTPLKAAPFIPNNTRNYERKYTGHISETEELVSDKSQIENLNINALNARNKKIFNIQSRKHAMVKPKVVYTANSEIEAELINEQFKQNQGYVTATPSIPSVPLRTDTLHFVTENDSAQPQNLLFTLANEVRNISSFKQDNKFSSLLSTTPPTPPATTLMHVFTLVEKVSDIDETTKRRPLISKTTDMDSKLKLIEINRIVEINSKLDSTAQRKATQELNDMHVEALPHVELLGEISVVKFVHLVDGRNIEIIDGHSMVTDNAPTESIIPKKAEHQTIHDKNVSRKAKSLLPEVIRGNFETSTLSLEGLFDSTRMAKQINMNKSIAADLETMQERSSQLEESVVNKTVSQSKESDLPVTNVRAIVPLVRPKSNESSTLIISIANLDKVILRKSSAPVEESNDIQSNTNKSSDFNSD